MAVNRQPLSHYSNVQQHHRYRTYDVSERPASQLVDDEGPPERGSKSDTALLYDIERERASVLDTPAPRKRPPQPTSYKQSSPAENRHRPVVQSMSPIILIKTGMIISFIAC